MHKGKIASRENLVKVYTGQASHIVNICGLVRELPIQRIDDELWIASNHKLVLGRDTEFTQKVGAELASRIREYKPEHLFTAETKSLPLVYETSTQLGLKEMLVARKSAKAYMENYIAVEVKSITTKEKQKLVFEYDKTGKDLERLRGKRIGIVDDVVTTYGTMEALERLVLKFGGEVVCKAAVWLEGPWYNGEDLIYLDTLPIFVAGKKYDELMEIGKK